MGFHNICFHGEIRKVSVPFGMKKATYPCIPWIRHSLSYPYKGRAKSSVTNKLPWFYPRYILKCFTALEWCVE